MISTGKGHVNVWTLTKKKDGGEGETELNKKQGLFTRKIDRPSSVTCAAFAKGNVEFLTGDSEGNVMVWKGIRVVRVLKGAHQGLVGDICVIEEVSQYLDSKNYSWLYQNYGTKVYVLLFCIFLGWLICIWGRKRCITNCFQLGI